MIGILLVAFSTLATEIGSTIGKATLTSHEQRVYPTAVILNAGGALLLLCFGLLLPANLFGPGLPGGFVFSLASLPFFLTRAVLELVQTNASLLAIARADRSAFGFLHTLTIP